MLRRNRDPSDLLGSLITSPCFCQCHLLHNLHLWQKIYIGKAGIRLGDRFQEHLCDVDRNDKDAFKPAAGHLNTPRHSKQQTAVYSLFLNIGSSESSKILEQQFTTESTNTFQ